MPSNKNALARIMVLDGLLSDRHHSYSISDLHEKVNAELRDSGIAEVSKRTIEKDIVFIESGFPSDDRFNATIERFPDHNQKGRMSNCLRYEDPSFSLFKKELTDDEKDILKGLLSLVGQFDGIPELEGLERLRNSLHINREDKQIVSFSKNPLSPYDSNIFGKLYTAIANKNTIRIDYCKFGDSVKTHIVYPYLLKEYNRRWFLFAAGITDRKILNFGIERIKNIEILLSGEYKYVEYDGDINERFEDIIGVTLHDDSTLQEIYFWTSDKSTDYVRTKPLHESQRHIKDVQTADSLRKRYPTLSGGDFYCIECKENYELIRELSSFGKDLIVLEPADLRNKIHDYAVSMADEYMKLRT